MTFLNDKKMEITLNWHLRLYVPVMAVLLKTSY